MERPERLSGNPLPLSEVLERSKYRGAYVLECVISRGGEVNDIRFLAPTDVAPEVRSLFVEALETWRFKPARRNGEPVAVVYTLTLHGCPLY